MVARAFAARVDQVDLPDEMEDSFIPYALSTITDRALPDARDGLKPVHRRILWGMYEYEHVTPDRPHKKSATVVGTVMGRLHPHGDQSLYLAMVRLGQTHSMSVPLVDPHGNFGSVDDDPAASRYTEARLSEPAMEMLADIGEDTVGFVGNFDGQHQEPVVLPAGLPNLLVNGTDGIATGIKTWIPSHNLGDVAALIELVMTQRRPKPTTAELMAALPGPDFPTGGIIIDDDGALAQMYETGVGSFRVRSRAKIGKDGRRGTIEFSELPFAVGVDQIMGQLKALVEAGGIDGIAEARNLSDRKSGIRLVVYCKVGVRPEAVLDQLWASSKVSLETRFSAQFYVLVNSVPVLANLYDLANYWIDHRLEVVERRHRWRLAKDEARLHLVEGLLKALDVIDVVVDTIRTSDSDEESHAKLKQRLKLSDEQATYILDLRLRRLNALSQLKLEEEAAELRGRIDEHRKILASDQRRRTIVLSELRAVAAAFAGPRRSQLVAGGDVPAAAPVDTNGNASLFDAGPVVGPCEVAVSTTGLVGRRDPHAPQPKPGRHDAITFRVQTNGSSLVRAVTDRARYLAVSAAAVPEVAGRSRGQRPAEVFGVERGERVVGLTADDAELPLMLVTASGKAKRLTPAEAAGVPAGAAIANLDSGDKVVAAFRADDTDEIAVVTSDAKVLRTSAGGIATKGKAAKPIDLISLAPGAQVVASGPVTDTHGLWAAFADSSVAAVAVSDVPAKGKRGQGVQLAKVSGDAQQVIAVWFARMTDALAVSDAGPVPLPEPGRRGAKPVPADGDPLAGVGEPR